MIASLRGLVAASVVAIVLAVLVVGLGGGGASAPRDRAIAPGFSSDAVTALAWPGARPIRIVRDPKSSTGWRWDAPAGEAETRTVDDVLAALRGARWHRDAEAAAAGATTATVEVERPGGTLRIAIGQPLAGSEQQWLVIGERALLVDAWVARALVPDPVALRVRAPLANAAVAKSIAFVPGVTLQGSPRRLVGATELLVNPQFVDALERALAELTVVAIPDGGGATPELSIQLDGVVVVRGLGPCPGARDRVLIDGPHVGPGCVDDDKWRAVVAAARAFEIPAEEPRRTRELARVVDKRPAAVDAVRVVLVDGTPLDLAKRPKIGDADADMRAVAELLAVLGTPAEWAPVPSARPTGTVVVEAKDARITLDVYAGGVVVRRGEPIGLRVGEGAHAILARTRAAYRERELWFEEATTVRVIAIGPKRFTRGAIIGEWLAGATARADGQAIEQLVGLAATLRSNGESATAPANPRTVEIEVVPPVGAPTKHAFAVGRAGAACAATVAGSHILVDAQICALVERLGR